MSRKIRKKKWVRLKFDIKKMEKALIEFMKEHGFWEEEKFMCDDGLIRDCTGYVYWQSPKKKKK